MTEHNNKYQNGKIYKITDIGYTKCYIGSTIQPLSKRMAEHRRHHNQYLSGTKNYIYSFELFDEFGMENCKIELLEEYSCENKEQLNKKAGEYIRKLNVLIKGQKEEAKQNIIMIVKNKYQNEIKYIVKESKKKCQNIIKHIVKKTKKN